MTQILIQIRYLVFHAGLLAITQGVALLAEPSPQPELDPYQKLVLGWLAQMEENDFSKPDAFVDNDHLQVVSLAAAAEIRAWRWTGDEKWLNLALARLHLLGKANAKARDAFFAIYPITYCVETLSANGRMDGDLKAQLGQLLSEIKPDAEIESLHNRAIMRACGFGNAAKLWPDLPNAAKWRVYAQTTEKKLLELQDVAENAPNYNRFDMLGIFLLEDVLGRDTILQKPGIRQMYLRYRDQISPAGFIPPYGDSGAGTEPFDEEWPCFASNAPDMASFERAARYWHDPTLRWAAQKIFTWEKAFPLKLEGYPKIDDVFYVGFAHDWADTSLAPAAPAFTSKILTRPDVPGHELPDKMILRATTDNGSPFVLVDLFVHGAHGHDDQPGAIGAFETGGHAVLLNTGYNNRAPEDASLFLMANAREVFPFLPPAQANVWSEAMLPMGRCQDPAVTQLKFRVVGVKTGITLWLSDISWDNGDGFKPMSEADVLKNWTGAAAPQVVSEDGHQVLKWEAPPGVSYFNLMNLHLNTLSPAKPFLRFSWKISRIEDADRPLIVQSGLFSFHVQLRQPEPGLTSYSVEDRPQAHFGRMSFDGWFTPDTRLTRRMVLCDDGTLVVADTVFAGASAVGMQGGPVWNPASKMVAEKSDHEFLLGPPERACLVSMSADVPILSGKQTVDLWMRKNHTAIYSKAMLGKNPIRFVSVFVPASPGAKKSASDVKVSYDSGGISVAISGALAKKIVLGDDKEWKVIPGSP